MRSIGYRTDGLLGLVACISANAGNVVIDSQQKATAAAMTAHSSSSI
jgi:hypothetical protein